MTQRGDSVTAQTMGHLQKVSYTHLDMIDFILAHPDCSQKDLAARYGYSAAWISNVMASDAWQVQYAARRSQLVDPVVALSIEERNKAIVRRSQEVLLAKLEQPAVSDQVALKAYELGCRSIGLGQPQSPPPGAGNADLANLAERLVSLQRDVKGRTYEGESTPIAEAGS